MSHNKVVRMVEELFRLGLDADTIGFLALEAVRK